MERPLLLAEAAAIADQLRARCLRTPRGDPAWIGPVGYGTELTPLRRVQLGPQLYDGTLGIALFFAALSRVQGADGDPFRELALQILAPLRRRLGELSADPERASQATFSLGGLIGLGSLLYGLLKSGDLLDEVDLLREAHAATVLVTPERIAGDQRVRVQTGCAGAILALLALHARQGGPNPAGRTALAIAGECGQRLLDTRVSFEGRPAAWPLSPGKPPLPGFSYGAAGISYALLRLYAATGRRELLDAAHEGLAFVRGLYSPEEGGWRDIRPLFQARYRPRQGTWRDWWASGTLDGLEEVVEPAPVPALFPTMWCHGGAGIALGGIGALALNDSPAIRQEIGATLSRAQAYARAPGELAGPDDLCCGHMGVLELLLCAAQTLGDAEALDAALVLIDRVRRRAEASGGYALSAARGQDVFAPSLFQGIAGVGYTLLRLAAPAEVPCLLLLE